MLCSNLLEFLCVHGMQSYPMSFGALYDLNANMQGPVESQLIDLLVSFDMKMDLMEECYICAEENQTNLLSSVTYASMVTYKNVQLALLMVSLNSTNIRMPCVLIGCTML